MDTKNKDTNDRKKGSKFQTLYNKRIKILVVCLLIALFVLIGRLYQLHIVNSEFLKKKSVQMRHQSYIHTYRGEIRDRNGILLASDITLYDVYAHPQYYKKYEIEHTDEIAKKLSLYLAIPADKLIKMLTQYDRSTVTLARKVNKNLVEKLRGLKINGLDFAKRNERRYPQGLLASHILGYMNSDSDISTGVEYSGKKILSNIPKMPEIEIDGLGEVIYNKDTQVEMVTAPPVGEPLALTIDSKLQHLCETELEKMIIEREADRGAVVMMDPRNGELLAFAVYPSYDPNNFKNVDPLTIKNWAITDVYPPGSTFKILTVASGLETGAININSTFNDTGQISVQGWTITNYDYYKNGAPGNINLMYLLEHSSNVGSAKIALSMKPKKHRDMLKKFGIGYRTGIDLPGESAGILKPLSEFDQITRATMGFGYGIASTPIQLASAVAAIANGGVWVTPHVIKYPETMAKTKIKYRRVLSPETAKTVTGLLKESISKSKAIAGKVPGYYVAGKTGTSRKPNPNGVGYIPNCVFTSFVGYLPADNPELLVMVLVDNPKGSEVWGNTVAGPVFNSIAEEAARYLNIKKDKPDESKVSVNE